MLKPTQYMAAMDAVKNDTYGEWPDYVEDVVSGVIWLTDPFAPGPENMWVRDDTPYKSEYTGLVWYKYTKRSSDV